MTDAKEAAERIVQAANMMGASADNAAGRRIAKMRYVVVMRDEAGVITVARAYLALLEERTELRTALQAAVARMKIAGPSYDYDDVILNCETVLEDRT